MVRTC